MTTKNELLEEFKQFVKDKREDAEIECNEESMMWQEDAEQPESEYYETAKYEYEKILKDKGELDALLDEIDDFLANK
jgi:hypothetical protein